MIWTNEMSQVHESGEIITLSRFCPWQAHLFDIGK